MAEKYSGKAHIKANAIDEKHNEYIFNLDLIIYQDNGLFIAHCPALVLASSGQSFNESIQNFYEAFQLHVEYCVENGTLIDDFKRHGWTITKNHIAPPKFSEMVSNQDMKEILDNNISFNRISSPFAISF